MSPMILLKRTGLPIALALCAAMPAHAGEGAWTVAESSGTVSLFVKGRPGAVQPGDAVPLDAALLTGRDGRAVLARGADRVVLSANGRLRFTATTGLFTDRGRSSFAFAGGADAVATPYLRASGTGGTFSITVTEGGATVQPGAGSVEVATLGGEARQRIEPGMVAIVGADRVDQLVVDGGRRALSSAASPVPAAAQDRNGAIEIAALQ